jgi:hypothetical protein
MIKMQAIRIKISDLLLTFALLILPKQHHQKRLLTDILIKYKQLSLSHHKTFPNELV